MIAYADLTQKTPALFYRHNRPCIWSLSVRDPCRAWVDCIYSRQNRASTIPIALEPTATSHQWPTVSPTYTYPPMSLEERKITDLVNNSPPDSLPPTMICNGTVELYLYTLWEYLKSACGEDQFVVTYPPKQVWGYNEGVIAMELRYDNTYLLFLKLTNEDSFRLYNYYTK